MTDERYGDAGLELLFRIQEACPEAGIASGLRLGAEILLGEYLKLKGQLYTARIDTRDSLTTLTRLDFV